VRDAMWDHALGRRPDLENDVAPAIAAISAPEMHFVTGTATVIDGGLIMLT
jgi:NAD(P)-dependent dehydrogenase (short-subunit alcohol dehydrogenase family)